MARHIKSGDQVMVIAGADKGKTGKVLRVLTNKDRVIIEGINRVWKHVRPSQRSPQGGRIRVGGHDMVNLCANNYLGLANHPEVIAAAHAGLDRRA